MMGMVRCSECTITFFTPGPEMESIPSWVTEICIVPESVTKSERLVSAWVG